MKTNGKPMIEVDRLVRKRAAEHVVRGFDERRVFADRHGFGDAAGDE